MHSAQVIKLLRQAGVTPDRRLGQNFLVNDAIAMQIAAEISTSDSVLEIGPGLGGLTTRLLPVCRSLTAIEISGGMVKLLRNIFVQDSFHPVTGDFLSVNPIELPGFPFDIVAGNLPYCISSPVLFRMLKDGFKSVRKAVFMLQREVAVRLSTLDGGKEYGKLSLQIWPFFTVRTLVDAEPEDFSPAPAVKSRVVVLERREQPLVNPELYRVFRKVVRISFASRRKIILNNLAAVYGKTEAMRLLQSADVDPGKRAEQMTPEMFVRLAENLVDIGRLKNDKD